MKRFNSMMLAGFGVVLLAAHVLVVWGGIQLTGKIDRLLPWIAGGSLAAFALYHVVRRILGKGHSYSHLSGGTLHDRQEVERGPHGGVLVNLGHGFVEISIFKAGESPRFRLFFHDKNKQARSVPANATVRVETVRSDNTRQTFDFHAKDGYLESTVPIPGPHEFKAIVQVSHGSHVHAPSEVDFFTP